MITSNFRGAKAKTVHFQHKLRVQSNQRILHCAILQHFVDLLLCFAFVIRYDCILPVFCDNIRIKRRIQIQLCHHVAINLNRNNFHVRNHNNPFARKLPPFGCSSMECDGMNIRQQQNSCTGKFALTIIRWRGENFVVGDQHVGINTENVPSNHSQMTVARHTRVLTSQPTQMPPAKMHNNCFHIKYCCDLLPLNARSNVRRRKGTMKYEHTIRYTHRNHPEWSRFG